MRGGEEEKEEQRREEREERAKERENWVDGTYGNTVTSVYTARIFGFAGGNFGRMARLHRLTVRRDKARDLSLL